MRRTYQNPCFHALPGKFYFLILAVLVLSGVAGCVPSPTATPPRQTPFPTLPLSDGTPTPEFEATKGLATRAVGTMQATSTAPLTPGSGTTAVPVPTNSAFTPDTLSPIVQMSVQDPTLPVSFEQQVPINVLAADDNIITRLELYDNDVLAGQTAVVVPAPVYSNQFLWKADPLGRHVLRAVAYDGQGNASQPAQLELSVINNNRPPSIQITSPSGFKEAELGAPVLIQGVATDDVAVTRLELIVDNQLVTFVVPEREGGVTPFAAALSWTPTTTGSHNIILRAFDNQDQSDDSLRYTIRVFDNAPPVVTAESEHSTLRADDVLVVNVLALSNNGIGRIELYVDERVAASVNSTSPSQQTSFGAALAAATDLAVGSHTYYVRAYDVTGLSTDTPRATVQVSADAPRIIRETPANAAARTPLPPTTTPTPQLVLPGPPTIELELTNAPVILPNAAQIQITARGSSELDRIELWARAPGEMSAQLLMQEVVKGSTEKTLRYEWQASQAGVVEMYARVSDNLNQSRESLPLRFGVQAPPPPTALPAVFDFAGAWFAESPAARFEAVFNQIGRALRGTFLELRTDGKILDGKIVSGAANEGTVLFAVDFGADASQTSHTLQFDCTFSERPPVLTCNYANENGERGSAVFQPLSP